MTTALVAALSSAACRPARRPVRHHPDPLLFVAGHMTLVVASAVALSFSVMTGAALLTRSHAHSRLLFSFALTAVYVLTVVVAVVVAMVVAVPVVSVPFIALGAAVVVGPTVVTKRAVVSQSTVLSTATTAGRATARRAPVHSGSLLSGAVVVGWFVVEIRSGARRGGVGGVGSAVVPKFVRYVAVVEGLHAVLVLVTVAAGSVELFAGRAVGSVDRA